MKIQESSREYRYTGKKNINKKKKVKRIIFWIKFSIISSLTITSIVLLLLSPLFNIKTIEVRGSKHYKEDDLIEASDLEFGANGFRTIGSSLGNILKFRYGNAEKKILEGRPYIKSAEARYILPDKIVINIVERNPAGVVPFYGSYLIVDNESYVLESLDKIDGYSLPLIKGLDFESFELGQALMLEDYEKFQSAMKITEEIAKSDQADDFKLLEKIDYIDISNPARVLLLYESRIIVNLGDLTDLSYRLDFLKQVLHKNLKKNEKGYLDFTTGENPSFMPEE